DGEMRCVVTLPRWRTDRTEARCRGCAGGIDALAQRFGEALRGEIRRRRDARGIAEKLCPVEIGALHRFDHQMDARRRVDLAELAPFKNVEHLHKDHAAGGGWRHRDDAVTAIIAEGGRTLDRPVALEILARHDAACRTDGGDELVGDGAAIEGPWSFLRNCA